MPGMILAVIAGVVLCAFHRARIRETEQKVREELEGQIKSERKLHMRDILRLYEEIMELQAELAAAGIKADKAVAESYNRGRLDKMQEMTESDRFIKAYDRQRVKLALTATG